MMEVLIWSSRERIGVGNYFIGGKHTVRECLVWGFYFVIFCDPEATKVVVVMNWRRLNLIGPFLKEHWQSFKYKTGFLLKKKSLTILNMLPNFSNMTLGILWALKKKLEPLWFLGNCCFGPLPFLYIFLYLFPMVPFRVLSIKLKDHRPSRFQLLFESTKHFITQSYLSICLFIFAIRDKFKTKYTLNEMHI